VTPQLISIQGIAFRGRPLSLLVAYAPAGSHLFRFSRRSLCFALPSNQLLEGTKTDETSVHHSKKETNH
jgi:hypothetical protein